MRSFYRHLRASRFQTRDSQIGQLCRIDIDKATKREMEWTHLTMPNHPRLGRITSSRNRKKQGKQTLSSGFGRLSQSSEHQLHPVLDRPRL